MWLLFLFYFFLRSTIYDLIPVSALTYEETHKQVLITASVGENRVTIYGYTSPNSRVELSSSRVFSVAYSDSEGYFVFDRTLLPKNPSDLCLSSYDNNNRMTSPVCIAPPPPANYQTDIGPILLSPTISLENDKINPNTTVITSGQSIPNSEVNLSFYKVNDSGISFPKEVQAYSLPSVSVVSDSQGNFSINLPTAYSSDYRLYASSKFLDNYSPKSNTLTYILPSLFSIFLQQNRFLFFLLPLFILTLIIFIYILHLRSTNYDLKTRYLPAIQNFFPVIRHVSLSTTTRKIKKP